MFNEEILKQKTNQDLRKICKDLKCAQYGDKATIIKRILETLETNDAQVEVDIPAPADTDDKDYQKMKKPQLIELLKKRKIGGFSNKPKAALISKLQKYDQEKDKLEREEAAMNQNFGECEQCVDLPNIKITTRALFNCFDKYLVRGYTNAAGVHVPPKWGPEMWSVYSKVLEERTRTTDKPEAWHRRLQEIIVRPHPDFDTFLKVLCEEWIFIKTNI